MKFLTWNVNKSTESRTGLWEMVQREDPDIVLLQEVNRIPKLFRNHYQFHEIRPRYFIGENAPFSMAVMARGSIDSTPYLKSNVEWINKIHKEQYGWIIDCEITISTGEQYWVVSVHLPSFEIPRNLWTEKNVAGIKLTNNRDLWFTEILWAQLRDVKISNDMNWIVAGDFNTSVLLDIPYNRGNQEIIDRLNSLGLTDCLSHCHHGAVATYMHSNKVVEHQLDYVYVNGPMLERLTQSRVPRQEDVFDQVLRLSDHLPIVCKFD